MADWAMADWADDVAGLIWALAHDNFAEEPVAKVCQRIAHDLRKAKASGMREAAEIAEGNKIAWAVVHDAPRVEACRIIRDTLRARADHIERGEDA